MDDTEWQRRLADIRAKAFENLKSGLRAVAQVTDILSQRTAPCDSDSLERLRHALHRMAESTDAFGCPELSVDCREMETQVQQWCNSGIPPAPYTLAALHERLKGLIARLEVSVEVAGSAQEDTSSKQALSARVAVLGEDGEQARMLCSALDGFGYSSQHFRHSQALADWHPDVIIAEHSGAGSSLMEVGERCASLEPLPALVVLSRYGDYDSRLEAVRAGAKGFFTYPIDLPALENRLKNLLTQQQHASYRVLIVDEDAEHAEHLRLVLAGANVESCILTESREVLSVLRGYLPDLILVGMQLTGCTGPELAQLIRLDDEWLKIPLLYLSTVEERDQQAWALSLAGDGVLTKPVSETQSVAVVLACAQRSRQLSEALLRDGLTGLMKRSVIREQLDIEVSRAHRTGRPACVVMLDIDRFKVINDSYGHAAGDYVIRMLANLLRQRLRKVDHIGRYGGEEFVAILPDCLPGSAQQIFDEIRCKFSALKCIAGDQIFHASFSAGIACTRDWPDSDAVLDIADMAMYQAKVQGRNQVRQSDATPMTVR
ncbi:diguanylate cyclase [Halomonas sp. WWR20]